MPVDPIDSMKTDVRHAGDCLDQARLAENVKSRSQYLSFVRKHLREALAELEDIEPERFGVQIWPLGCANLSPPWWLQEGGRWGAPPVLFDTKQEATIFAESLNRTRPADAEFRYHPAAYN